MSTTNPVPATEHAAKAVIDIDVVRQLHLAEKQIADLQNQLSHLTERFNYVLIATQDAVWDWDLTNNIAWYSDGMNMLFGHAPTSGDGVKFWSDNIHPDDRDRVVTGIHEVIDNGGKHWQSRYRFRKSDGLYAWVFDRGYAIHNDAGIPVRMVGSMQDITDEVEAKEALRESEEKFRGAFDHVAMGISICTPQGEFLAVNKAYPKIFGYTEEEIAAKRISDLSHPDEIEGDRKIIRELLAGNAQQVAREKRYLHKSGKVIWGKVFGTVVYDSAGAPKYLVGVLEDVTVQRETEAAIRENEERLRLVVDAAKIGTWDFNPRTGKMLWDARTRSLFGMDSSDYIDYDRFLELLHPDDRLTAHQANQDALSGIVDGEYDIEYRAIGLRDQQLRWIRAKGRSYRDERGTTIRYAGTVIDITKEKLHEQSLIEKEERFRLLATSIPQIVWTTDANGIVDYMSDKWTTYTGHVPTYAQFSFREVMHPEDLEKIIPEWNECMQQAKTFHGEYRLQNLHTGEYRWYRCTTSPLKAGDGTVIKWIGSAHDIHDQKMVEINLERKVQERTSELTEMNERLQKSNAELEQYAYVTSHDLKEPLRKIQIYNDLVKNKFAERLAPEAFQYLSKIESASTRMSGLIHDLLKYSRLSNPVNLLDVVNLDTVTGNVITDFEHALKQKNISVEIDTLPIIKAVPFQMHQLFFNLIGNSIKFTKPDATNRIRISCSVLSDDERTQYQGLKIPGRHYKIAIEDEGVGFSEKYNEQIFTIFQRLHNRTQYEGHGIGLALCRKIVHNHHGLIWATGEEQKGARFTIIIPESFSA